MKVKELKNKLILTIIYACVLLLLWRLRMPCLFQHFFGIACPGCGMSHAVFSALKLDFAKAFSSHPMFWSMPILYMYFILDFSSLKHKTLHYIILIVIVVGFVVNWIVQIFMSFTMS